MTEQQNTRPSASREIAVKPLKWYENGTRSIAYAPDGHYWILDCHDGQWGLIERGKNGFTVGHGNACLFTGPEDARLGADILNRKRVLANLCADTAPGNTDPIAKYDDELRKVQGGWVDAVVYEARFLVDRLKEYEADGCQCDESVRQWNGHVSAPLARLEMALSDATTPTEHPTEQPSVRDVLSKAANDAIQGYAERTDRYASGVRNGIFTMRKAILRSLAQEGE